MSQETNRPRAKFKVLAPLWVGALTLGIGCGDDGSITVLVPKIDSAPEPGSPLTFPSVIFGRSAPGELFIEVKNVGTGTLEVREVRLEGQGAAAILVKQAPTTVAPNGSREIYLRFEPASPTVVDASLIIASNDRDRPEISFPIRGLAREPCVLAADQSHLYFNVGEVRPLVLTSVSSHPCTIERMLLDRDLFPIIEEPELPITIESGAHLTLQIEHRAVSGLPVGAPVRELRIDEADGSRVSALLEGEPPLAGCLSWFPDLLTFLATELGDEDTRYVTVSNRCDKPATITSAVINFGWEDFRLATGPFPAVVEARGSLQVGVTYAPTPHDRTLVEDQGRLILNTNDALKPRLRVGLSGTPGLPDLEYFPSRLDFGTVIHRTPGASQRSECSSAGRFFQLHNTGGGALTVTGLELAGGGDGDFLLASIEVDGQPVSNLTDPFSVPPGKVAKVGLVFFPTRLDPALHEAEVLVTSNATRDPVSIRLAGMSAADGPVTDTHTQLVGPKADILWVIDNSCSMYDEQARLVDNLSQFVSYADSLDSDYQMGVTVTDGLSSQAGLLEFCYPHPRVVSHTYADRIDAFECLFRVGIEGSPNEAGMAAAMRALQRAQSPIQDPVLNPNAGFLRDDASLAIVMLTDEDDNSIEPDALFEAYFKSIKGPGGESQVKVHAIATPVDEPCVTDMRFGTPGYRYKGITEAMGGRFFNICLEDWQPILRNLGLDVFTLLTQWSLSQAASPGSVTVTVDGVPIPPSADNGYVYNAGTNVVEFRGAAVPQPGQEVSFSYLGNCTP